MRRAIVTGGASGIGRAVVERLCANDVTVDVLDVADPDPRLREACRFHRVDVSDVHDLIALLERLQGPEDPVDSLVCCAGVKLRRTLSDTTVHEWNHTHDVNVRAAAYATRAVLPGMEAHGSGSIVLLGSPSANGDPSSAMYASSKAALVGFAASMAMSLASTGVRINTVVAALTRTAMTAHLPESAITAAAARTASGRANRSDDIADSVMFLLGPDSRNISGSVLDVGRLAGEPVRPASPPAPHEAKGLR